MNILMFGAVIYLGFMLFKGGQAPEETRPSSEIFAQMKVQNAELLDVTIFQTSNALKSQLSKEVESGDLEQEEADRIEMHAAILVADTQFKSGLYRGQLGTADATWDFQKVTKAHQTLKPLFETSNKKGDLWTDEFEVTPAPDVDVAYESISGKALYDTLVDDLKEKSKSQKVMGLIPGYGMMEFLVNLTGAKPGFSYWFAALILAVLVRIAVWPLAQKQYMWGRQIAQLQPYLKEIQEKFKDKKTGKVTDPQAMQAETMKLYKEYGMNPLAGCGPALIQMPLFLLVYQCMMLYKFEFTAGHFLWMDGSAGGRILGFMQLAPNVGERDHLMVLLYGITMVGTTLVQPVSDPNNWKQQKMMGVGMALFFSIAMFFWPIPAAFPIYWTFTNLLTGAHTLYAYRQPIPKLEKVGTAEGGHFPSGGVIDAKAQQVDPDFFGKTGTPKKVKKKKKKSR